MCVYWLSWSQISVSLSDFFCGMRHYFHSNCRAVVCGAINQPGMQLFWSFLTFLTYCKKFSPIYRTARLSCAFPTILIIAALLEIKNEIQNRQLINIAQNSIVTMELFCQVMFPIDLHGMQKLLQHLYNWEMFHSRSEHNCVKH